MALDKKDIRITAIKNKLLECYKSPLDKKSIFDNLINEIAWQFFVLEDARAKIKIEGFIVDFNQGKQSIRIMNPLQKLYDQTLKNLSITIKTMEELYKNSLAGNDKEADNDMTQFLNIAKDTKNKVSKG